jgi:hypothetical protein
MTKREALEILWIKYDYCMLGFSKELLYKNMSKKEALNRLADEELRGGR